jgi:hypothetical protein
MCIYALFVNAQARYRKHNLLVGPNGWRPSDYALAAISTANGAGENRQLRHACPAGLGVGTASIFFH